MNLLLILTQFAISLVIPIILIVALVFVARHTRMITLFFFYCFLASAVYLIPLYEIGSNYLQFFGDSGVVIDTTLLAFSLPHHQLHTYFSALIVKVASYVLQDTTSLSNFLVSNIYFYVGLPFGAFLLSSIIFRKKKKVKISNSRYND